MKTSLCLSLTLIASAVLAGCAQRAATVTTVPATTVVSTVPAATVTTTTNTAAVGAPAAKLSAADQQFVAVAAGAGMYEVEAARLAVTKASNAQVRGYAQMLLDHHTANNNELMTLVSSKGHRVAPGLPAALQQKVTTLSGLSGADFDREFVRTTGVQDHTAAVAAFEQHRRTVTDRDLQAYIDKSLPVLRSHLQQAQDLAGRMAG
jgi:putative membrane protein